METQAPTRSAERNKALVRRFIDAIDGREVAALDDLLAPDFVRHSQATPEATEMGRERFYEFLQRDFDAVPDSTHDIGVLIAEEDRVAVWATYRGTQRGPWGSFPPSGKALEVDFAGFFRIERDKIAELWVTWDNLAALVQLGHLQPPG